jgi:uncharacterized membrane protein
MPRHSAGDILRPNTWSAFGCRPCSGQRGSKARKQGIGKSEVVLLPNRSTNLAGKTRAVPGYWVQLVAVVAFIALLGVVAIMVSAVATNLGDLFLALASVFVLAFSGWFVVAHLTSRRR